MFTGPTNRSSCYADTLVKVGDSTAKTSKSCRDKPPKLLKMPSKSNALAAAMSDDER